MEQLLIFLLLALGSAISGYLQKKKRQQTEADLLRKPSGQAPVPPRPSTGPQWQEELRRILQGETSPPVVPPKVPVPAPPRPQPAPTRGLPPVLPEPSEGSLVLPSPLTQSATIHHRASQIARRIEQRFEAVDTQTTTHRPAAKQVLKSVPPGAAVVKRAVSSRDSLREAFLASLIFAPPLAMEPFNQEQS